MEDPMQTVTSSDGTTIAYGRYGDGPAVILVGGAMSYRRFKKYVQISEALADRCTVINYDRRGRGDSGEAGPVSVQREVDDIAALIGAVGGHASLFGWSSGGALAVRAAAADIGVERLVAYETPFMVDPGLKFPTRDYSERLDELVAAGEQRRAAKHFMRNAIGMPGPLVTVMSLLPMFMGFAATAHTLPFDWAALGPHNMYGSPLQAAEWAGVTCPTLVAYGAKSPASLQNGSRALAEVLPNASLRELEGQTHNISVKAIVPLLTEFVADGALAEAIVA
jgi:pimeloyl-ACP methyl ester carboxylesterase